MENLEPNGRVSLKCISELQTRFAPVGSTAACLRVADTTELIDRNLVAALTAATHSNPAKRQRSQLAAYLQSGQHVVNQRELVAVFRSLHGANVITNESMRGHVLTVMQYVITHGLKDKYASECMVMRPLFDDTLTATYTHMKKEHLDLEAFWGRYGAPSAPHRQGRRLPDDYCGE